MKRNPSQKLINIAAIALVLSIAGSTRAAVLTFDAGFSNNTDVNGNYGSNIVGNSTEFITTDPLGAAPNIALTWPTANQFEFHGGNNWEEVENVTVTGDGSDHTVQVNNSVSGRTVTFTPDAGFGVIFGSVDYGIASDLGGTTPNTVTFEIRDSGNSLVKMATSSALLPGQAETVDLSYTGAIGESYTLEVLSNSVANWGAIDDLTFGQSATVIPEPSSTALLGLSSLALILRRRA
ncbi:MAG: PEP-CTERM sorting domain-containing protein [Akkermansiaceae bacterium]